MSEKQDSSASHDARVESLRQELAALRGRISFGTTLVLLAALVAGAAAAGELLLYTHHFKPAVDEVATPERIVAIGEQYLDEKIPEVKTQIESEVNRNAAVWAQNLSNQAVQGLPTVRERLEEYVVRHVGESADHVDFLSEQTFRDFLRTNKVQLEKQFETLSREPDVAEGQINELATLLERHVQADMQLQSREFTSALTLCIEKLKRLSDPASKLTEEEQHEKRVAMLARRLQIERAPGASGAAVVAPTTAPSRSKSDRLLPEDQAAAAEKKAAETPKATDKPAEPAPAKTAEETDQPKAPEKPKDDAPKRP